MANKIQILLYIITYPLQQVPSLGDHIQGEESAEFTNTLGEQITVKIFDNERETANLLAKVRSSYFHKEL